jgi:serine protease
MIVNFLTRRATRAALTAVSAAVAISLLPATSRAAGYVPGEVVVGYMPREAVTVSADIATVARAAHSATPSTIARQGAPTFKVIKLPRGMTVKAEIARLRHQPGVAYAVPNYIAHAAGSFIPNDPGRSHTPGGWQRMQWNFLPGTGVNAPEAWANLIAGHRAGGRGVTIAVLDTGIAYRNWGRFKKSPDFTTTHFVAPHDFVATDPTRCDSRNKQEPESPRYPLDREGHGTFVAGEIAEATNNHFGLTGLAYNATIMPVRVLDACGDGDASSIASGIRWAVQHHAKIINLSLEFQLGLTSSDIPNIISAIAYAHRHGVVVVAAAGNEGVSQLAYPAASPAVISVGASTRDGCLADYSNGGPRLDLVAPGGGDDSSHLSDPNCHPDRSLPNINQLTLLNPDQPGKFGYPTDVYGTSMSAPEVAATAALVVASGVLGRNPTPARILARLEQTATPLGGTVPNSNYGYGLVNAGAATMPIATVAERPQESHQSEVAAKSS